MNKYLIGCISLLSVIFPSCAKEIVEPVDEPVNNEEVKPQPQQGKVLVVYFSATGTTQKAAKEIATATNGQLVEIQPEQKYTSADLDWHDNNSRTSKEMNDASARPSIKNEKLSLNEVQIVFIGYPIWWNQAPRVINTFIDATDLKGKKIILFCTSGSSSIDGSLRSLRDTYPTLNIVQGKNMNGMSKSSIESWVKSLGL
ncbi:MAG: NAD(P)H-dependent oxidoreductase [Muribaculaceae bacterium]|nr:NAD(P)H-dependent oxidoreductase [Muribaculaceae bacterium]